MSKVVLFQGDSITDCFRVREEEGNLGNGYPFFTSLRLKVEHLEEDFQFINRGISGDRVVDLYARWKIDALNLKPDVLSILIGVNDTWHEMERQNGVEVPRYDEFYRRLLDWTLETLPNVKIVLMEPFVLKCGVVEDSWVVEINERRKVVKQIAEDYKLPYVLLQDRLTKASEDCNSAEFILRDGVHPTVHGHQIITNAWLEATKGLF